VGGPYTCLGPQKHSGGGTSRAVSGYQVKGGGLLAFSGDVGSERQGFLGSGSEPHMHLGDGNCVVGWSSYFITLAAAAAVAAAAVAQTIKV